MRRARQELTARAAEALRCPKGKRQAELADRNVLGLVLRCYPTGRKRWLLRYRANGAERRYAIGDYPGIGIAAARVEARALMAKVDRGGDPQRERREEARKRAAAATVAEWAERWLRRREHEVAQGIRRPRSVAEDRRKLKVEVLPEWGSRKLADISRADVRELLEAVLLERGGVCCNRTRALLGALFADAVAADVVPGNPVRDVPKLFAEQPRERVLSEAEVRALWAALGGLSPTVAAAWRLVLLTAQRPGEVCRLRWCDLTTDAAGSWWELPPEIAKSGRGHRVPLSAAALEVLEGLRPLTGAGEWALAARKGWKSKRATDKPQPLANLKDSTRRIRAAAGLADVTPHDLRRTAATWLGRQGVRPDVIERLLNHSPGRLEQTYNTARYDEQKRQAVVLLAGLVEAAVTGEQPAGARVLRIADR